MVRFEVTLLSVGTGEIGICPVPGRAGDYGGDLEVIRRWRPDLVLTMTTEAELACVGAASFGADLTAQGTGWHHLPIEDFGAPGGETLALWPAASQQARRRLARGGRVLVHCHGGCGRSGMAALRLLIEAGEAPETALRRLRNARPCAVETTKQLAWAMAGRPEPA